MYSASVACALARVAPDALALIGVRPDAAALLPAEASIPSVPLGGGRHQRWLQLHADRDARATGARLAHYTNAVAPLRSRLPYVLTVHDLSLVRLPSTHPVARRLNVPLNLWSIARAAAVLVPTDWTRHEITRLRLPARRVTAVPYAPTVAADQPGDDAALARHGLSASEYVIQVGTLEPRKNVARLVAAFEVLAADRPEVRLVLAGAPGWHYRPIEERINSSPVRERIVVTGYVPAAELVALVRGAAAVAYVSLYEGYGLPVRDAMALGAAVVTSNRTGMPEAADGAGLLVDPLDPWAIARALERAISERDTMGRAAARRAASWTWDDVARAYLDVYRWAAA
jgi:glycosyltransferase involved in cell wall biosynthesis